MITSTFDSTKTPLKDLLVDAGTGALRLPDFQREWIWDDDHVLDLIASVSMSFPVGAVMLLEAGGDTPFKTRSVAGAGAPTKSAAALILDGQQRLTALFQSLTGKEAVQTRDPKGAELLRWYYIDIHLALDPSTDRREALRSIPSDRLVKTNFGRDIAEDYSSPEKEYEAFMFPLRAAFNYFEWRTGFFRFWRYDADKTKLWDDFEGAVLQAFSGYLVPVISLRKDTPKEAVCLVFEKVNTGGVALTVFELLTAMFAASAPARGDHDFQLRDDWNHRHADLNRHKVLSGVSSIEFLQAITLLATYTKRQDARSSGESDEERLPLGCRRRDMLRLTYLEYRRWADQVQSAYIWAAKFLHKHRIFDPRYLPYTTQLVPLVVLRVLLGGQADEEAAFTKLSQWFWCGVFGELYGASTETRFARDVSDVPEWLRGGPLPRTVFDANFTPDRLTTLRTRRSAAYRGIYCLLLRQGARDFRTGEEFALHTYFDEAVDIHHIFPQHWCRTIGGIDAARADSVLNKTPLSATTNRIIGGAAPSVYLKSLQDNHAVDARNLDNHIESHFGDPSALRSDDFDMFLARRRDALVAAISTAMGKALVVEPEEGHYPEPTYEDLESLDEAS